MTPPLMSSILAITYLTLARRVLYIRSVASKSVLMYAKSCGTFLMRDWVFRLKIMVSIHEMKSLPLCMFYFKEPLCSDDHSCFSLILACRFRIFLSSEDADDDEGCE